MNPAPFSDRQIEALQESLSQQVVKTRVQGGRTLSYIEGWWAISEANRVFGFGSWNQQIIDIRCVSERERKIGQAKKDGWAVSYVTTIRLTVNGVIREGVGAGHGIDADLGLAHESAAKEAATDAMKRAFMTFGNIFGLALYDKHQRNVEDRPPSLEHVPEVEKADKKFTEALFAKMNQVGVQSAGVMTLRQILQVTDFEQVDSSLRRKLIDRLTPEYATQLNAGKNSKGQQVLKMAEPESVTE